jgi:hypothetical protein
LMVDPGDAATDFQVGGAIIGEVERKH